MLTIAIVPSPAPVMPLNTAVVSGAYISVYYDATRYTPGNSTTTTPTPTGAPVTVTQVANYNYIGCYSEGTNGRALTGAIPAMPATGDTVEECQAACSGFTYFGVEYVNEYYYGNSEFDGSEYIP